MQTVSAVSKSHDVSRLVDLMLGAVRGGGVVSLSENEKKQALFGKVLLVVGFNDFVKNIVQDLSPLNIFAKVLANADCRESVASLAAEFVEDLDSTLVTADFIIFADTSEGLPCVLTQQRIASLKEGVIVMNALGVGSELVDRTALQDAVESGDLTVMWLACPEGCPIFKKYNCQKNMSCIEFTSYGGFLDETALLGA